MRILAVLIVLFAQPNATAQEVGRDWSREGLLPVAEPPLVIDYNASSADLSPQARKVLDEAASWLDPIRGSLLVATIVARAEDASTVSDLQQRRATAAREYLLARGANPVYVGIGVHILPANGVDSTLRAGQTVVFKKPLSSAGIVAPRCPGDPRCPV